MVKQKLFKIKLLLAKVGFFKHHGLMGSSSARILPQAQVKYKDGQLSVPMPIGNAVDYATIFGGTVIPTGENL